MNCDNASRKKPTKKVFLPIPASSPRVLTFWQNSGIKSTYPVCSFPFSTWLVNSFPFHFSNVLRFWWLKSLYASWQNCFHAVIVLHCLTTAPLLCMLSSLKYPYDGQTWGLGTSVQLVGKKKKKKNAFFIQKYNVLKKIQDKESVGNEVRCCNTWELVTLVLFLMWPIVIKCIFYDTCFMACKELICSSLKSIYKWITPVITLAVSSFSC